MAGIEYRDRFYMVATVFKTNANIVAMVSNVKSIQVLKETK